ncbi:MAG: MFS transporter [Planctomycetota bacterium]
MISKFPGRSRQAVLRRNLRAMNADGFSFSVMVGIAETYLPAFVLSRGFGEFAAALIATLPVLLGSLLQLWAPILLQHLGSYRRFVVITASLQSFSVFLLMLLAFYPGLQAWMVFVPATTYWAAGLSTGPAWNLWAEQLVPARIRSGFFARRSRLCHVGVLAGLASGGLLLRWSAMNPSTWPIFAVLFGIGALGRLISSRMLAKQTEVLCPASARTHASDTPKAEAASLPGFWSQLQIPRAAGRLVAFLVLIQVAVHVSGPYFNPFMLRVMQLSWVDYMTLLSLGFIGKMLSLPSAARFANRFGADRLLWAGSLGIVPISAFWFCSQEFWFLAGIQILSGLVWGWYELAMLLQFFRRIPAERRVFVLTVYNAGNSAAMVLGTIIGACVLQGLERTADAYLAVFLLSGCLRALCLLALPDRRQAVATTVTAVQLMQRQVRGRATRVHPGGSTLSGLHPGTVVAAVGESAFVRETPA